MLSYLFYAIYFLFCLSSIYLVFRYKILLLYPLIFTSHFNVTTFFKIGVSFSFFEINLIIVSITILIYHILNQTNLYKGIKFIKQDYIWLYFIIFSLISIFIACVRVLLNNLYPNPDIGTTFFFRSLMSLNKLFFYLPCFYIIRVHLLYFFSIEKIRKVVLLSIGLSGILPVLATVLQISQIGFSLLHNNPSFAETYRIDHYIGSRPVGLTNEASFFVYQLFFSFLALYYSWKEKLIVTSQYYLLATLYIIGVLLSVSRTGLLIFALFYLIIFLRQFKTTLTFKSILKFLTFTPLIFLFIVIIARINISNINIGERFLSSFQQSSDLSTLERYGSSEALFNLFLDKSLFFGVGVYNFQYYILNYIPTYMDNFYYPKGSTPSSFNFILQILVEFGLIISFIFFYLVRYNIFNKYNDRFFKDWFLFLFIFSLSFQTLNFAIPFIIFFYPSNKNEKNSLLN